MTKLSHALVLGVFAFGACLVISSCGAAPEQVLAVSDQSWSVDGGSPAVLVRQDCIPGSWAKPPETPPAKWIWASNCTATDTEAHKFSHVFGISDVGAVLQLHIAADNDALVSVNGQSVGSRIEGFSNVTIVDLSKAVRSGDNTLEIEVRNQSIGASPGWGNPAGLLAWLVSSRSQGAQPTPANPVAHSGDISGLWQSDWGPVTLHVDANGDVTGSWDQGKGTPGTIKSGHFDAKSRHLDITFYQPWNNENGTAALDLSDDGLKLAGTWKHSSGSGTWTMTRGASTGTATSLAPSAGSAATSTASVSAPADFHPCFINAGSIAAMAPCNGKPGTKIYIHLSRALAAPLVQIIFKPYQVTGIPGASGAAVTAPLSGNATKADEFDEIDAPPQLCLGGGGSWDLFPLDALGKTQGDIGRFTVDCR
jgi:hypothetical protein